MFVHIIEVVILDDVCLQNEMHIDMMCYALCLYRNTKTTSDKLYMHVLVHARAHTHTHTHTHTYDGNKLLSLLFLVLSFIVSVE